MTRSTGPLAGLRVIELGTLLAGPFCGQLLGDFGAEVIKVEPPGQGDPMRVWGREKAHGKSLWWPVVARNKKSITLDLRQAEGQELLKSLVAEADFLLENFRPGTLEKWGLGWSELSAINPRLIMIRVSGFGQTGPYSRQAGFGAIGEAMGGLRYVVGDPTTPPSRMGISIGDSLAATFACIGALTALHHRRHDGPWPGHRLGDLRSRAQHDGVAGHRVRQGGVHPRAHRRDPAERRAVERLPDPRRHGPDRGQPGHGVHAPGRRDGPAGPGAGSDVTPRMARAGPTSRNSTRWSSNGRSRSPRTMRSR